MKEPCLATARETGVKELELLAPAANREIAIEAILHGADAVYIGGPSHGARKKAGNSVQDIADVVKFAHQFRAKVYVTVNTLVYPGELKKVENLVWQLYRVGVDALIVQDMALLRMNLPPIPLHASTQCDTRTPEKAEFLDKVGFSQIVLARELSLQEIRSIASRVSVPVECFVHGALCVSYSGRCAISQATLGRSANRGECAQMCRMSYSLENGEGKMVIKDKHLLSLRDFNTLDSLGELIEAGVSSFKIEGRLKEMEYVKNVTAAYNRRLNEYIASHPGKYRRASYGKCEISFAPLLQKSFNRGFTDYFLHQRRPVAKMTSPLTPKSMGEIIGDIAELHNGDGISFFNAKGEYEGVMVNGVDKGKILANRPFRLPPGAEIHRTSDVQWRKLLARPTATRTLCLEISIDSSGISAKDERGVRVRIPLDSPVEKARNQFSPEKQLAKLGNTPYRLTSFTNHLPADTFIPPSHLSALRRRLVEVLNFANESTYPFSMRRNEDKETKYCTDKLDFRDNVANPLAERFWHEHGVVKIEKALEVRSGNEKAEAGASAGDLCELMTTRYCLRREYGCCLRDKNVDPSRRKLFAPPLSLITGGNHHFLLEFDCVNCEMRVLGKMR